MAAQDLAVVIEAEVPLSQMFGFSTDLRSATQVSPIKTLGLLSVCRQRLFFGLKTPPQLPSSLLCSRLHHSPRLLYPLIFPPLHPLLPPQGKGEFTMEYLRHAPVAGDVRRELLKKYEQERAAERK